MTLNSDTNYKSSKVNAFIIQLSISRVPIPIVCHGAIESNHVSDAIAAISNDLEDQMIISKPPTNSATNVCSRIFLPRCLLGKKSGRYLAVTQVAAKVYRPIESLLFFVRAMRCDRLMPYKYIWGSRFRSELSFSSASRSASGTLERPIMRLLLVPARILARFILSLIAFDSARFTFECILTKDGERDTLI